MEVDQLGFSLAVTVKAPARHSNTHREEAAVAIELRCHRKLESCRHHQRFRLRYRLLHQSIHRRFLLPVSISIPRSGRI